MPARVPQQTTRFWGRGAACRIAGIAFVLVSLAKAEAQQSKAATAEIPPEAEVEPSPIPGTEILLAPQLPSSEAPVPGRTLKLGPPAMVEPMLPPVNFEAFGRSGRLWSF